jgi:hypothetical protein
VCELAIPVFAIIMPIPPAVCTFEAFVEGEQAVLAFAITILPVTLFVSGWHASKGTDTVISPETLNDTGFKFSFDDVYIPAIEEGVSTLINLTLIKY